MYTLTLGWILIFISSCVSAVYLYVTRNYNYWRKQKVKQVSPTFPFGNIGSCLTGRKNPIKLMADVYQKGEGERMIGFYSFDKPHLLLRDPELIKHVLVRDFHNFSNKILIGDKKSDPFGAKSLFLVKNPPWKHIRSKLTPIFTSGKLKNMFRLMLDICQDFHDHLDKLDIDDKVGKPVEVKELLGKFMTDIIGTTAFGLQLNSLKNDDAEFRRRGRTMFRGGFKRYIELLSIFFLPALRPLTNAKFFDKEGSDFLRQSFWAVINERIEAGIKRPDLIELLIEIKKSQENDSSDKFKLEGDDLVAQAAIFFTGGFETTSTTASFALYELANHPEIQMRLKDEILEGIESHGGITYEMITTLPYLNMVIQEVQRMYPILPWLDRIPEHDYTFSGTNVTLKKGFPVILPLGAMQRDPKYFSSPEKFDPERFSEINKAKMTPFTYFPFGEGPRQCIGERLGLIQTKLAVVSFLSKYELTFCKETLNPLKLEEYHVLNQVKGNLFLNLRKTST